MQIQPTNNLNFGNKKFYQRTTQTSYGKCIKGTNGNYDYSVYVSENPLTKIIATKLYYITKKNKWVKSFLRFYRDNKVVKEIRSQAIC